MSTLNNYPVWNQQPLQQQQEGEVSDTGGQGSEPVGNESVSEVSEYSLSDGFLKDVPEEHRSIVEPYVKKWDAGVTRRFQDLNGKYKPYEELGIDSETLPQFKEVWEMLNDNPKALYDLLAEALADELGDNNSQETQEQNLGNQNNEGAFQAPPEMLKQFEQQQKMIETLAQIVIGEQESKKTSAEEAEFDNLLGLLKTELGEFDEEYVVMKIANGMAPEEAVRSYQTFVKNVLNQNGAGENNSGGTPPLLSGAGGFSGEQQNLKNLSRQDTKKLVAETLARTAAAQQ